MDQSTVYLRAASADDQATIRRIVGEARLNPMHIDWPNFVVAERIVPAPQSTAREIVGVGQIKPHGDGSRELASIAVLPEFQRLGIAAVLILALLAREKGDLYLYCGDTMPDYYTRFGFVEVGPASLPRAIGRWFRFGRTAVTVMAALLGEKHTLHAMHRPPA